MEVQISSEVEKFVLTLEQATISKVLRAIDLLRLFGFRLGMPHSKKITENLYELRTRGQQEIRIFYIFKNGVGILIHGFMKKTQTTPAREIKTALSKLSSS